MYWKDVQERVSVPEGNTSRRSRFRARLIETGVERVEVVSG